MWSLLLLTAAATNATAPANASSSLFHVPSQTELLSSMSSLLESLNWSGRMLKEKPSRKFCNTTLAGSLTGDYAYEACGAFCKQAKAQNHCKFCKCRACAFCKMPAQAAAIVDKTPSLSKEKKHSSKLKKLKVMQREEAGGAKKSSRGGMGGKGGKRKRGGMGGKGGKTKNHFPKGKAGPTAER